MAPNKKLTALVAIGGNSLIVSEQKQTIPDQYEAVVGTVQHIAELIESNWNVVVTHGSGPQVGFILRRSELASNEVSQVPMDYADADIQGAVGYMFQRALYNEFIRRGIARSAVTVVTQVLVDAKDPAFDLPSKPIGPCLDEYTAKKRADELGWVLKEDNENGWKRVVSSPQPKKIIELDQIKSLLNSNSVVIACGGGGIPVVEDNNKCLVGVEAVVDKDLASGLLASELNADIFLISTNVDRVAINFRKQNQTWLNDITLAKAREYYKNNHFEVGSMGPKVKAMITFLENGGKKGIITSNKNIKLALRGTSGTIFTQ